MEEAAKLWAHDTRHGRSGGSWGLTEASGKEQAHARVGPTTAPGTSGSTGQTGLGRCVAGAGPTPPPPAPLPRRPAPDSDKCDGPRACARARGPPGGSDEEAPEHPYPPLPPSLLEAAEQAAHLWQVSPNPQPNRPPRPPHPRAEGSLLKKVHGCVHPPVPPGVLVQPPPPGMHWMGGWGEISPPPSGRLAYAQPLSP